MNPIDFTPRDEPLGQPAAPVPPQTFEMTQGAFTPTPGAQPYFDPTTPLGQPPAPQPPKANIRVVAAATAGVVLFLVATLIATRVFHGTAETGHAPEVAVVSCDYDGVFVHLRYTVTNRDTVAHDYYATGTVDHHPMMPDTLTGVAPGETASGELLGAGEAGSRCDLTNVEQR